MSDRDLLLEIIERLTRIEAGYVTREELTRSRRFTIAVTLSTFVGVAAIAATRFA